VKFEIIDRGQCFKPLGAARSYDAGDYLVLMANAPVLGIKPPPEWDIPLNWFIVFVRDINADGKIDIRNIAALVFYPDSKYRSPEEMLKAARSFDDGGILVAKPPSF